jgi:predicted house-cleaning noncanonical NTP pyrophosphatase (MazG superfamily)
MSDEEIKDKIKEIIDNPGTAIEKGVKTVIDFGKELTDTMTEKIKEKEKRGKRNYDEHQNTLMMSDKGTK